MQIRSYTTLKNDYKCIVTLATETQEPIYITNKGKCEILVMSKEAYEDRELILKHRAALLESEFSRLNGDPTYTVDEVRAKLKQMYQNG